MLVYFLVLLAFLSFFLMTSLGLIIRGESMKGSCGGIAVMGADGEPLSCSSCYRRAKKNLAKSNSQVLKKNKIED